MSIDFERSERTAFDLSGKVVVVDRNLAAAQETVDLITAEGANGYAVQADVAEKDDCQRIFDDVMQRSGRVDGMVYSVAINPPFDRVNNSMTTADFNHGINVNMLGCYYCNLYAAQCMEKNDGNTIGSIVNISSIASIKNEVGLNIGLMPYALGKCGLNYITELTAAQYAGAGIRANTLMLGPIDSTLGNTDSQSLFGFSPEEVDQAYSEVVKLKMGRASAWETGYAALYLLADESRFMTGQQIRLDGGATLVR